MHNGEAFGNFHGRTHALEATLDLEGLEGEERSRRRTELKFMCAENQRSGLLKMLTTISAAPLCANRSTTVYPHAWRRNPPGTGPALCLTAITLPPPTYQTLHGSSWARLGACFHKKIRGSE